MLGAIVLVEFIFVDSRLSHLESSVFKLLTWICLGPR